VTTVEPQVAEPDPDRAGLSWDFPDLVTRSATSLSAAALDFVLAGAGGERNTVDDVRAWSRVQLLPRVLAGVREVDTGIEVLGTAVRSPIMVAPTGGHGLVHPGAETATARGAADAGCIMVLSAYSNVSLERVASEVPDHHRWFQVPHELGRPDVAELVRRAVRADYRAIVLTVDQIVSGSSPRGRRGADELPRDLILGNLPGQPRYVTAYHPSRQTLAPVLQTPDDIAWLAEISSVPVVVKGILRREDAVRCVEAGARGVVVSNHGGRHLDGTVSTAEALASVVTAVAGRAEVFVDGGIRRGEDVLKALALGARAVLVGRAPLLGLALDGSRGVQRVLDEMRDQLLRAMALCGASSVSELDPDLIRWCGRDLAP
jgi:4-hydroxymandelate oxidase